MVKGVIGGDQGSNMCTPESTICNRNYAMARRTRWCAAVLHAIVKHMGNGTRMYKIDLNGCSPVLASLVACAVACLVDAIYVISTCHFNTSDICP